MQTQPLFNLRACNSNPVQFNPHATRLLSNLTFIQLNCYNHEIQVCSGLDVKTFAKFQVFKTEGQFVTIQRRERDSFALNQHKTDLHNN